MWTNLQNEIVVYFIKKFFFFLFLESYNSLRHNVKVPLNWSILVKVIGHYNILSISLKCLSFNNGKSFTNVLLKHWWDTNTKRVLIKYYTTIKMTFFKWFKKKTKLWETYHMIKYEMPTIAQSLEKNIYLMSADLFLQDVLLFKRKYFH